MSRVQDVYPGDRVSLREVGLRDGLQLVKKFPTTAAKQRWIREEYAAGVRHFEVGSFLPAKTFPQFADVRDIVKTAISMALGCSIVGPVDPNEVIRIAAKLYEIGVDMVAVADTVGYAGPKQVGELTKAVVGIAGSKPVCVHLHDTRGMGIANASSALDAGARVLDGSLGGLGGCPFAPGATGNVVFEDLVFLCESKGFTTGIDIERLVAVRAILRSEMPGEALYGGLARAGLPGGTAAKAA